MTRRLLALVAIVSLLLLGALAVASSAEASVSCHTSSRMMHLTDGNDVDIKVAWTEFHVEICTNGNEITSSQAWSDITTTAPAEAAGFDMHLASPYRSMFHSGRRHTHGAVIYNDNGSSRECIPYITLLCSDNETWQEHVRVEMYPAGTKWRFGMLPAYHLHGRMFIPKWTAHCTNRVCATRFDAWK